MPEIPEIVASVNDVVQFRIWEGPYSIVSENPPQFKRESNDCTCGTGIVQKVEISNEEMSKDRIVTIGHYLLKVISVECGDISVHQQSTSGDELWVNHTEIIGLLAGNDSLFYVERGTADDSV